MPRKVTLDRYEVGLVRNGMQMPPVIVIFDIFNHHCQCDHNNDHNHDQVNLVSLVKNNRWSSCRNCGFHYYVTRRQHHEHLVGEEDKEDGDHYHVTRRQHHEHLVGGDHGEDDNDGDAIKNIARGTTDSGSIT